MSPLSDLKNKEESFDERHKMQTTANYERKAKRRRGRKRAKSATRLQLTCLIVLTCHLLIGSHLCHQLTSTSEHQNQTSLEYEVDDESNDELTAKSINLSRGATGGEDGPSSHTPNTERRTFAMELLKLLHEQQAGASSTRPQVFESRQSLPVGPMMRQLLEAISGDGDMRRLTDWARNSFSPTALGEILTQFVVSKLGSVNCPALLRPDKEEQLVPRFLLFNEHYTDVPFELTINPNANECLVNAKLDPLRKTVVLIHGYLTGYTLVDGITNIKNRLLDLNRLTGERALEAFVRASQNNGTYVLADDLQLKVRQQLYNVIIVDWFTGANPTPRSNYIKAAVNAQVVGRLIARFLSALIVQCQTPASNLQIIAHSLGCHVSGFTGKELNAAGHRLAKITHLDPVGLCFGRLFSKPSLRLSPNDAQDTQAVHTSLNIFDNPLDGVHSNFLVNGGRDQTGCGGQNEVKNSTTSSVSLLFDPAAKFAPCSHLRALSLFEDNMSSQTGQCQMVGYRCPSYDRFLAGKCGQCDATNSQCRLMSLPPVNLQFRKITLSSTPVPLDEEFKSSHGGPKRTNLTYTDDLQVASANEQPYYSMISSNLTTTTCKPTTPGHLYGAPSNYVALTGSSGSGSNRSERRLDAGGGAAAKPARLVQVIGRIRADTRAALAGGWTTLRGLREPSNVIKGTDGEFLDDELVVDEPQATGDLSSNTTATNNSTRSLDGPTKLASSGQRLHQVDFVDQIPLGSQPIPRGNLMGPLFFLGTGSMSPYCVNYYQFRVLIAESRIQRVLQSNGLASNRLAPPIGHESLTASVMDARQRAGQWAGRDMLHLTVKLTDQSGHFFKGFSMLENARQMGRVFDEAGPPLISPLRGPTTGGREPMLELTMLLNTTRPEPVRVTETIISYYFHSIVLADRVELNYMSNISPE